MGRPFCGSTFEIIHGMVTIRGERLDLPHQEVYRLVFSSPRQPIIIARAEREDGSVFWTSIPEGRQKEAEGLGAFLENHWKNN